MDDKKLKFEKIKDGAKQVAVSDFGIEIKAKNDNELLECYEANIENKKTKEKK